MNLSIFINVMFAGIIAFGVVYNAARVSLSERSRELASLRVLGFTRAEISLILLGELAVLTLVALPVGGVIGYSLGCGHRWARSTARSTGSRSYVSRQAVAWSFLGVIAAALVSACSSGGGSTARSGGGAEDPGMIVETGSGRCASLEHKKRDLRCAVAASCLAVAASPWRCGRHVDRGRRRACRDAGPLQVTVDEDGETRVRDSSSCRRRWPDACSASSSSRAIGRPRQDGRRAHARRQHAAAARSAHAGELRGGGRGRARGGGTGARRAPARSRRTRPCADDASPPTGTDEGGAISATTSKPPRRPSPQPRMHCAPPSSPSDVPKASFNSRRARLAAPSTSGRQWTSSRRSTARSSSGCARAKASCPPANRCSRSASRAGSRSSRTCSRPTPFASRPAPRVLIEQWGGDTRSRPRAPRRAVGLHEGLGARRRGAARERHHRLRRSLPKPRGSATATASRCAS